MKILAFGMFAAVAGGMLCATLFLDAQPGPAPLALAGGRVIASPDAAPIDDGVVLMDRGRIEAVGAREAVTVPAAARTIDCRGLVVVAGFQNSHVHFTEPRWTDAASQPASTLASALQSMLTKYGFTTVVDTGSLLPNTVALRQRIDSGDVAGPRILTAGIPLYPPDGIPYYLKDGSVPPDLLKLLHQPATPKDAGRDVDGNIDGGADIIKLFTGSWVANDRVLPMPADIAAAAVAEAHRRGRMVFAHTSSVAGLEVTLSAGVDVIAHALDETRGLTPEHFARMRRQNVALIPTLTLFAAGDNAGKIFREVLDYSALGGDILFGTDVGYHQMYDTRLEFQSLRTAGLSWRQILASLTTTPARRFKEGERRGRLARGLDADVVVLGADPRSDATAFADVRYTIRRGTVIYARLGK